MIGDTDTGVSAEGTPGPSGVPGTNGVDGVSPTITVSSSTDTEYMLTITDVNGSFTTPNLKGQNGTGGGGTGGASGITTQDVPLAWTLLEEAKIMYAPLDVDGDTFARILGAYSIVDDAILKAPGVFSMAGAIPIYMYVGQLYGAQIGDGYCVLADLRDIYAVGGATAEIMLEFYQGTFTNLKLYILEG